MWTLKTITEDIPERTFRISTGAIRTIGRSTGADFIVDAALVSQGALPAVGAARR